LQLISNEARSNAEGEVEFKFQPEGLIVDVRCKL
jgi:hypothetical protein